MISSVFVPLVTKRFIYTFLKPSIASNSKFPFSSVISLTVSTTVTVSLTPSTVVVSFSVSPLPMITL